MVSGKAIFSLQKILHPTGGYDITLAHIFLTIVARNIIIFIRAGSLQVRRLLLQDMYYLWDNGKENGNQRDYWDYIGV